MHFIIQPDQLKTAFSAVKTVAARTNALPVLNNILFRPSPDGQQFLLTCGDGDKAVTLPLPVEEPADLRPFLFPFMALFPISLHINTPWLLVIISHSEIYFVNNGKCWDLIH